MDRIRVYTGGMVEGNGYLFKLEKDTYVAIDAPEGFASWIKARNPQAKVTDLLITHQHFDHVQDAALMKEMFHCPIHAAAPYSPELTLETLAQNSWGLDFQLRPYEVDDVIGEDCQTASWGGLLWHLHHVPGHSPDSIVYQLPDEEIIFSGDTIFAGSIGRTDLPGGNEALLLKNLEQKVLSQPYSSLIYPGHGPYTTIHHESHSNPYLY